jgi:cytochrome b
VSSATRRVRVWDLPTRLFHWLLAALVVFSFTTGKVGGGWMDWHVKSGYAILALLLFRLAWGFVGSETARFASFLRGPRAFGAYAADLFGGRHARITGHNPMGGWMIAFMIAILAVQAACGLFADDEISTQGPLAATVSNAWVSRLTSIHYYNGWVVLAAVCVHVATIGIYQWLLRDDLVRPMLTGWRELPAGTPAAQPAMASNLAAAVTLAAACAAVYWLVAIFPRP